MLKALKLNNLGPAAQMELEFGPRLNLFTGDNGLGKSFLLDTIWGTMTGKWPAEMNPGLTSSRMALPNDKSLDASIELRVAAINGEQSETRLFDRNTQSWSYSHERASTPSFIVYAMPDDNFAVWDSERSQRSDQKAPTSRPGAYVFTPYEVWDGLQTPDGS